MLSGRYVHLHEALGLGPMWLKRGAQPTAATVEVTAAAPVDDQQANRLPEDHATTPQPDATPANHPLVAVAAVSSDATEPTFPNVTTQAAPSTPFSVIRQGLQAKQSHDETLAAPNIEPPFTPLQTVQSLWSSRASVPEQIADCTACGLHQERRQALMSPPDAAKLMIISLNPALQDDDEGQLFAGRHGRLLLNMLAAIGLTRDDAHYSTWLRCAPRLHLQPSLAEQVACSAHLQAEIARQQPQALLLLGEKFADETQQWLLQQIAPDVAHFIVPHPAVLLQNPLRKARVWPVLQQLRTALQN